MKGDPKAPAPARASRTQTISYVDLMKPDEDWRNLPDASERRKIQNRLAQRAYRRNMRDRTREVERLKNQLKKLQEEKQEGQEAPTQTQEEEDYSGSDSGSSTQSAKGDSEAQMDDLNSSTIATSEWLGRYFQVWPENTEPERVGCMDIASSGDSLAHHLNGAACYSDYQLSPDFQQQIIAQPRPMLAKAQDIIPGPSTANLAHQQHAMQSDRAMNEPMFYPKAAYQMPWPNQSQNQNQRNLTFEAMGTPMGSEQNRRMMLPSPPTSLGQPDLIASPHHHHHQRKPSKPTVGRLLNTELRLSQEGGGKVSETVPGYLPSPISELSEQVWQRAKLSSPSQSLLPSRPPSQLSQRTQQQQQQNHHLQQHHQHATPSSYTQQLPTPQMTPIAEATDPRTSRPCSAASSASTMRRPASPEKSPVLEKKQKQKKSEISSRRSRGGTPNNNHNNNHNNANTADHQTTTTTTTTTPQPTSLLHLAVAGGHVDTLRLLLQKLDPEALNARNDRGYTALECAVMEGRTDLVALLLEHGAGGGVAR
ncbi:hypothetical protein PG993_013276 [Apiospora rasikravindrae]|uniref:BZIP domain-containing protein n=1 Tax=Apiospora rasikravindrae TaxID=990691 RepID=A0ABR1RX81_9PEZI